MLEAIGVTVVFSVSRFVRLRWIVHDMRDRHPMVKVSDTGRLLYPAYQSKQPITNGK